MLKQKFFLAVLTLAMTGAVVANAQEAKPDSTKTAGAQELKEDERIYARRSQIQRCHSSEKCTISPDRKVPSRSPLYRGLSFFILRVRAV